MSDTTDYCRFCFHEKTDHEDKDGVICDCLKEGCSCTLYEYGETRVTSPTGGKKGVKDERFDLVPPYPLALMAKLYGFGAKKYAEHNWRKGYDWSKSYASAMRHMTQFWDGEDIDPETGIPHVICASFHMFVLAQFMKDHRDLDDRYVPEQVEPDKSYDIREKEHGL